MLNCNALDELVTTGLYSCNADLWFVIFTQNIIFVKADLLAQYGGVAPKMAEEAHARVIDQVLHLV